MPAKGLDLRIELRIVSVRLGDGRLRVVDDQRPGNAAEVMKRILQTANEVVGGLAINRFAVGIP